jgi:hypothetical protein
MKDIKQLKKFISNTAHFAINKELALKLGGYDEAVVLQHFIDLQSNLFNNNEFYQQQDRLQAELHLSEYKLKSAINKLKEFNLITVTKKGMPSKNYYYVNFEKVYEFIMITSDKLVKNHLTSEVVSNESQLGENQPTSEVKTNPQVKQFSPNKWGENQLTNTRNKNKKIKQEINDQKTRNNDPGNLVPGNAYDAIKLGFDIRNYIEGTV